MFIDINVSRINAGRGMISMITTAMTPIATNTSLLRPPVIL
jgi:hypothetical protein